MQDNKHTTLDSDIANVRDADKQDLHTKDSYVSQSIKAKETKIILIVGASGVGKDTLLRAAQKHFHTLKTKGRDYGLCFIQRYIDREPSVHESNHFYTPQQFKEYKNDFLSIWESHHHIYGIKKADIKPLSIISVSRNAIADFEQAYQHVIVVHITSNMQNLQARLKQRGREDEEQIRARLKRSDAPVYAKHLIIFDNNLPLVASMHAFNTLLEQLITS